MNLSEWAKNNGIHYRTAWRWFREGELPVPARQLETGTILALDKDCVGDSFSGRVVVYARVSGHDRKEGLDGQVASCLRFAEGYGLSISERVTEIGSGLNGHRKKLLRILADPCVKTIVVEHRDRLSERFGAEYVEAALEAR
ncbi:MAG: IS607 family transposase, partial [Synergistales bacterium]|nr:IS607 family transposase [Synergistales bacterium]